MTLTIKDSLELTSPGKSGSSSQNSENKSGLSPRSNPACLEVPVTIRSLPEQDGDAPESDGPIREEGRTVIVFDNGAVLRLSKTPPSAQKVILSNAQGQNVVCRLVNGRNLPTVKGYIEVEFIEQVNDFWRIHQSEGPANVSPPPVPPRTSQLPHPVVPPPAPPVTPPRPVTPENETMSPSGRAPTFEDIAGVMRISPSSAAPVKAGAHAAPASALKSKNEARSDQSEPAKSPTAISAPSPLSDAASERCAIPPAQQTSFSPIRKPSPSNDFMARGMLASGQMSPGSSRGEGRRRMPLIIGGAVLVLAGLGAGYFYMHQESAPTPAAPVAAAALPSTPLPSAQTSEAELAQISQPAEDQAPDQSQTVSEISATAPAAEVSSSSDVQGSPREANNTGAKPPDRASKQRQQIPNLRMRSPLVPKQDLARLSSGSSLTAADVSPALAIGGAPSSAILSPVARSESQPAPPPSLVSSAPTSRTVREPKLISFTRPTYPSQARQSNTQGIVVVSAALDVNGNVIDAKAIRGPVSLRQAAIEAVRQWKYSPALIDGKPSAARVTVNVEFRLN
jgi:TonB family protein